MQKVTHNSIVHNGTVRADLTEAGRATRGARRHRSGQRPLEHPSGRGTCRDGIRTLDVVADPSLLEALPLDPGRQLIGSQCSGALVLAELGLRGRCRWCTDTTSRPFVEDRGVTVLDSPFHVEGSIATAGGCFASQISPLGRSAGHSAMPRRERRSTTWRRSREGRDGPARVATIRAGAPA